MPRFENNRLTPVKPVKTSPKFATYDIEGKNWNEFVMGGFYDGERYFLALELKTLGDYIFQHRYKDHIIYAHFGGGYDHRFILEYLYQHRPDLKVTIIENHGNILGLTVQTKDEKHSWRFYDSYQVIKGSLKDLTKIFDTRHKKLDTDRKNIEDTPETRLYLEHDCKGLYEVIEKFYNLPMLQGVSHKMTTSSLAMSVFRLNYLKDTVLYKLDEEKENFVREGYFGGRTEIFKMKGENVREYDINSMYVSAMLEPIPCQGKGIWAKGYHFEPGTCAFLEITFTCPKSLHIPVLPVKHDGKLIFPAGTGRGVYFSPEVAYAFSLGYDIKIHRALVFPAKPFLKNYAQDCWDIRNNNPGKNGINTTAKLLGNGLYGKFAQKREREMMVQVPFEEGAKNGWKLIFPEFGLWKKPTISDSPAILPYISAAITSYSRITLHKFLNLYPDKVVYCDTDSVFIEEMELPSSNNLGDMKYEESYKRFIAIQPKFYLAEYVKPKREWVDLSLHLPTGHSKNIPVVREKVHKLRAKGFISDRLTWDYGTFDHALKTGDYKEFFQEQEEKMSKLNEAIRIKNFLALVQRKKGVKSPYTKREVNRKTWETTPIIL